MQQNTNSSSVNNNKIHCECGSYIKKNNMRQHLKTKKHKKYIESKIGNVDQNSSNNSGNNSG